MTRGNDLARRTTMASGHRARGADHRRGREARIRRSFDGVVASYLRSLSAPGDTTPHHESGR
jgi:hypothetical protein